MATTKLSAEQTSAVLAECQFSTIVFGSSDPTINELQTTHQKGSAEKVTASCIIERENNQRHLLLVFHGLSNNGTKRTQSAFNEFYTNTFGNIIKMHKDQKSGCLEALRKMFHRYYVDLQITAPEGYMFRNISPNGMAANNGMAAVLPGQPVLRKNGQPIIQRSIIFRVYLDPEQFSDVSFIHHGVKLYDVEASNTAKFYAQPANRETMINACEPEAIAEFNSQMSTGNFIYDLVTTDDSATTVVTPQPATPELTPATIITATAAELAAWVDAHPGAGITTLPADINQARLIIAAKLSA